MELSNQELDQRLLDLGAEIHAVELALVSASKEYELAKAGYENAIDEAYLTKKATNSDITVKELEASARAENYELRLNMIEKEAVMKGLRSKVSQIETKIGILQSIIKLRVSEMRSL